MRLPFGWIGSLIIGVGQVTGAVRRAQKPCDGKKMIEK